MTDVDHDRTAALGNAALAVEDSVAAAKSEAPGVLALPFDEGDLGGEAGDL